MQVWKDTALTERSELLKSSEWLSRSGVQNTTGELKSAEWICSFSSTLTLPAHRELHFPNSTPRVSLSRHCSSHKQVEEGKNLQNLLIFRSRFVNRAHHTLGTAVCCVSRPCKPLKQNRARYCKGCKGKLQVLSSCLSWITWCWVWRQWISWKRSWIHFLFKSRPCTECSVRCLMCQKTSL